MVLAENKAGKDQTFCKLTLKLLPNVDETAYISPDAFKSLETSPAKPERDDEDEKDKKRYMPPRVIVPLTNIRISEGEPFKLECKIDGYPAPKVDLREIKTVLFERFFKLNDVFN